MQSLREFFHVVERVGAGSSGVGFGVGHQRPHGDRHPARGQGSRSRVRRKKLGKGSRVQRRLRPEDERGSSEDVSDLLDGLELQDKVRGELLLCLKYLRRP